MLASSLASASLAPASAAAGPPRLDVTKSCDAATEAAGRDRKFCLEDEDNARTMLTRDWSTYQPADTARCLAIVKSGGPPSYVELLLCLETGRWSTGTRAGPSIMEEAPPPPKSQQQR